MGNGLIFLYYLTRDPRATGGERWRDVEGQNTAVLVLEIQV